MDTNGINLNTNDEQDKKDGKRTAFVLGAVAALGVAGALGLGFMLGGNGGSSSGEGQRQVGEVAPTQAPKSPAAALGEVNSASNDSGSSGDDSNVTPPTNTAEPETPTETAVPATETPVPPTETPTEEPTATATPGDGCPFCIDPGIVVVIDFTAPVFESGGRTHCPEGTIVAVTLDESADIWVEYTFFGGDFTSDVEHGEFGYFNLGGGPFIFPAMNIVVHAKDAWGNESTFAPPLTVCS